MTDNDRPPLVLQRALDAIIALVCLGLAAIAIGYEATTAVPAVVHEHVVSAEKVSDIVGIIGMAFMAPYAYLLEWADRHDRLRAQFWRKAGWGCQVILLALCIGVDLTDHKSMLIPISISTVITGAIAWAGWMRTQFLPPEDQAVVDHFIIERDRKVATAAQAAEQRRRERRFDRAVRRYQPSSEVSMPAPRSPADPESYPWPIPEGKHQPLIYFVRNGDRVKIGTTTNVRNRMSGLSLRTTDIVLLLSGGRHAEQGLHRQFAAQRVGNTEWFEYPGPVADYVTIQTARARANDTKKG